MTVTKESWLLVFIMKHEIEDAIAESSFFFFVFFLKAGKLQISLLGDR